MYLKLAWPIIGNSFPTNNMKFRVYVQPEPIYLTKIRAIKTWPVVDTYFLMQNISCNIYLQSDYLEVPVFIPKYEARHISKTLYIPETRSVANIYVFIENMKLGMYLTPDIYLKSSRLLVLVFLSKIYSPSSTYHLYLSSNKNTVCKNLTVCKYLFSYQ